MATHLIFDKKYFVSFSYEERTMQRKMFKPKFSLLLSVKHDPGFVHFFVNRIQDFFQTFSRPFFLFSRLKITVKFFIAREEIIVLIMKTTNKKKKTVSAV